MGGVADHGSDAADAARLVVSGTSIGARCSVVHHGGNERRRAAVVRCGWNGLDAVTAWKRSVVKDSACAKVGGCERQDGASAWKERDTGDVPFFGSIKRGRLDLFTLMRSSYGQTGRRANSTLR